MNETKTLPANPFRRARFLLSANSLDQCPEDTGCEIAFAGRSNVGKSSVINLLTENHGLARTSKTPGRTQLLNFFALNETQRLVDLPGYGFARVPEKVRKHWGEVLQAYFDQRQCLQGLVLIMDARHPLKPFDQQMLAWCRSVRLPAHIVLNKSDKLSRGAASKSQDIVRKAIADDQFSVQLLSTLKATGLETLQAVMLGWLGAQPH